MSSVVETREACAVDVQLTDDELIVHLDDGRTITTPLAWYPRLVHATLEERSNFRLVGQGIGIHWPDLDEDLSIAGMLTGARSGEGPESFKAWLKSRRGGPRSIVS